jgi:hypothetical protein
MDVLARRVDALYLGARVLLVENILGLELLIPSALVIYSLALIHQHVLIMFYLRDLLLFGGPFQHRVRDHVVRFLVLTVLGDFVVGANAILRICSVMSLIFFHIQTYNYYYI